jgi:T5SS/PEP-CTERM-associated repeat protein
MNSLCRLAVVGVIILPAISFSFISKSYAVISHGGSVSPAPPGGGGPVTGPFRIGDNDLGFMHIADGTALTSSNNSVVGNATNSIGIVTMDGFGSNWNLSSASGDLTVGANGIGSVYVSNLAKMDVADQTILGSAATGYGEVVVEGIGSQWLSDDLIVGQSGSGVVNLTLGGRLSTGVLIVGVNASGQGRIRVTDPMSYLTVNDSTNIGSLGQGELFITNAGRVRTSEGVTLGNSNSSVGLIEISDTGSILDVANGSLTVGATGSGRLNIFNGGKANIAGSLQLANNTGSLGEVLVQGNNSTLIAGSISTGVSDSLLTIASGGVVAVGNSTWGTKARLKLDEGRFEASESLTNHGLIEGSGTINVASFNNNQGQTTRGRLQVASEERLLLTGTLNNAGFVNVDGGELETIDNVTNNFDIDARNGAKLRFGNLGLDNNTGSQFAITAGVVDVFGSVQNDSGAQIVVGNGASAVFHDTLTNNGGLFIMPGASLFVTDQINFGGNASVLNFQLSAGDAFDELFPIEASDLVNLNGELSVTLAAGYEPQLGDVIPLLISAQTLSGDFSQENFPGLPAGLAWETLRTVNSLSLEVVSSGSGDFDGDGDVDGRDFLAWQRNPSIGDLANWQDSYALNDLAATVAVPESPSMGLLVLAGILLPRLSPAQKR